MLSREARFIDRMRALAGTPAARGLNDDGAVVDDLVITHDMLVIGTHVLADCAPEDVAWKLVGVNLSDLAAKGAMPVGVFYGHMLGEDAWDARFADALGQALAHYNTALLGGDTVDGGTGARAFGMTAIGRASHQPVPSRAGARPGDRLWVTGTIGDAFAGFLSDSGQWTGTHRVPDAAIARYRRPAPRLAEGAALAPHVTAMMDVSDGLLLDASRLAATSGVTIHLDSAAIPVSASVAADPALVDQALRWGDDYELLFALPASAAPPVDASCIGTIERSGAHPLLVDGGAPDPANPLGYEHHGK